MGDSVGLSQLLSPFFGIYASWVSITFSERGGQRLPRLIVYLVFSADED